MGLSLYFAYNIVSGNLTNYINTRFAWLAYVAAIIFGLLGAISAYELTKLRRENNPHECSDHGDHNHSHISWGVLAITMLPLALGFLLPSSPLGSEAINGSVNTTAVSVGSAVTLTTDPLQWNILDWLRTFNKSTDLASFNGQEANFVGFVYREPGFSKEQFMVARFTFNCCVADANAIGLPVVWDGDDTLTDNTWVNVQGNFQLSSFKDQQMPVLHATSVEIIEQPEHPYLYP